MSVLEKVVPSNVLDALRTFLTPQTRAQLPEIPYQLRERGMSPLVTEAIEQFPREAALRDVQQARTATLLSSMEVATVTRWIVAQRLSERDASITADLHGTLEWLTRAFLDLPSDAASSAARVILDLLLATTRDYLERLSHVFPLIDLPSADTQNRHVLRNEIAAARNASQFFSTEPPINIAAVQQFRISYRAQTAARHSVITPPHLDTLQEYPLDQLYVAPEFHPFDRRLGPRPARIPEDVLISDLYKLVILGNPGAGKSTFAAKLCYDVANDPERAHLPGRRVVPILITLREYGSFKRTKRDSLLQFIASDCAGTYQLSQVTSSLIEYMLVMGNVLLIFDGLDELLDTSFRRIVSRDVSLFCNRYPAVPVVVTSRRVGYEQAPLNADVFPTYELSEFTPSQSADYSQKWFSLDRTVASDSRSRLARRFNAESSVVSELRANPLMLALMCNLYRGEGYIPKNRPDVYHKCALMLFERWDRNRGIRVRLRFEQHIRPAMEYLAYWIYQDEVLQSGVTESQLVWATVQFLSPRRFEKEEDATAAAQEFIEFCRDRAWVFTDAGTTATGERLYKFTHRTFLEYFAAAHLVFTSPQAEDLSARLLPRIQRREWDVVAQLAFQLYDGKSDGAGSTLLTILLDDAVSDTTDVETRLNELSFAARALAFLVAWPETTRRVSRVAGGEALIAFKKTESRKTSTTANARMALWSGLLAPADENQGVVKDELAKLLAASVVSAAGPDAVRFAEAALNLALALQGDPEALQPWHVDGAFANAVSADAFDLNPERFAEIALTDVVVFASAARQCRLRIADLVREHGIRTLFLRQRLRVFEREATSVLERLTWDGLRLLFRRPCANPAWTIAQLRWLGTSTSHTAWPWVAIRDFKGAQTVLDSMERASPPPRALRSKIELLPRDALFGLFTLLAASVETRGGDVTFVNESASPKTIETIAELLSARGNWTDRPSFDNTIAEIGFTEVQNNFIWRWIGHEITLITR